MVVQLHFLGGQTEKSSANDFWHGKHVKLSVGKQQFFGVSSSAAVFFFVHFSEQTICCFLCEKEKKSFHFSFGDGKELLWFPIKKKQGALGLVLSICCQLPFLS